MKYTYLQDNCISNNRSVAMNGSYFIFGIKKYILPIWGGFKTY